MNGGSTERFKMITCKLKDAREAAGFTQKRLAEISGVPQTKISQYENGSQIPNYETVARLANALGVNWFALIEVKP